MNPFSILVAVIITIALIFGLLMLFPDLFPTDNPRELLSNNLNGAELKLGKPVFKDITFSAGTSLSAGIFDTGRRSVAFECNNPVICCNLDEKCGLIEWDKRSIFFASTKRTRTASRCIQEQGIFSCKIYFGAAPAQIKIKNIQIKNEIDLGKEDATIKLEIENSGEKTIFFGQVKLEIHQKYLEDGIWKRSIAGKTTKTLPLKDFEGGKTEFFEVPLDLGTGRYEADITASGEDAGFDKNTVAFRLTGIKDCFPKTCDAPEIDSYTGECKTACHCEQCLFGTHCEEKVKAKKSEELGLPAGIGLGSSTANVLDSFTVEFVLDPRFC